VLLPSDTHRKLITSITTVFIFICHLITDSPSYISVAKLFPKKVEDK
jgi:hypothetical protein